MTASAFKEKIADALDNQILRGALGRFGDAYLTARQQVYEGYDFAELRNRVSEIKADAAARLDELLDRFEQAAAGRGAKVYRAKDAGAACDYIIKLAQAGGVKNIVKSKSMASEEIHLNQALQAEGFDVQETDLGEWIIQLAGQRPSHMVMPAIHMTKEQVADVFTGHLNRPNDPDISALVQTARIELRKKFLTADMGISGANMAVAETGTLIMMTNEGNARLTSTLPRVHVFLVGVEKMVPTLTDAAYIMQTLPRSATAQKITSYVSMITGPTPAYYSDGTVHDKEFHIVLLDNGRRKMYADDKFKKAFQCIRCASCLNVCPAVQLVGGHVYGHIYTGGIGTILTAFLNSESAAANPQNLCLQCGKCAEVCPGKLDIPEMILELRNRLGTKQGLPFTQKFALDIVSNRRLFHSLLKVAAKAQKPLTKGAPVIRHLPFFLSGMTAKKSLPAIAERPFRDIFPEIKQTVPVVNGTVALYAGCLVDFVYPRIGEGVVAVLNQKGYRVTFPDAQSCCGAPATYMGDRENALKSARLNIDALAAEHADYIVSACPTCTHTLKHSYPDLLAGTNYTESAKALSSKVWDFSLLLSKLGGLEDSALKLAHSAVNSTNRENMTITYHDSCHLRRKMNVYEEPRHHLQQIEGIDLIEMAESDRCCGFAGSYSIKFPELSQPILDRKLQNILNSQAQAVAVDCPGCLMQIAGGLDKLGSPVQVKHTAEILLDALATPQPDRANS